MDDGALMKDLAAGDRRALRVLYERHAEFIYRVAFRFLACEDDARDVTQSVFVSLLQSAHRYRPEAKFTTWLYRVAVNGCLNHRSKANHRQAVMLTDREVEEKAAPDESQPDQVLELTRRAARVRAAVRALPERQRIALILSHFEGKSYDEVAEALGCSKSSVESLLFRARQSLARHLASGPSGEVSQRERVL